MDETSNLNSCCWVTLLTDPSYLPGVIVLAHSLDKYESSFPLVVMYTSSLGSEETAVLEVEMKRSGRIKPNMVELLSPREGQENVGAVADRFKDTFTKLRAFEIYKLGFTKACFLDADIAAFQKPGAIFEQILPDYNWIAANHSCVCNLDGNAWAPEDWHKGNCAYTTLISSEEIVQLGNQNSRQTYQLINGGVFLFQPSEQLWKELMTYFDASKKLRDYQFPDQDFLADFFADKRTVMSWKYNALKTMKYVHPQFWSDSHVVFLHYIVDKPWARSITSNGIAGHMGRDGETHSWWWDLYKCWHNIERPRDEGAVACIERLIKTHEPFTEHLPLPQSPGTLQDITLSRNDNDGFR